MEINKQTYQKRQLHKFGGSSLSDVTCYERVIKIIKNFANTSDIIIVSASGETTDYLIKWSKYFFKKNYLDADKIYKKLKNYHIKLIKNLLPSNIGKLLINKFLKEISNFPKLINKNFSNNICTDIIGFGEIWSARLINAILNYKNFKSNWIDAREFLYAENSMQPQINENKSQILLNTIINKNKNICLIIPGFICRNEKGETVLLGRNGSDYSATQIGALAKVSCVTLWSDVAGIYTADPRKIKNARLIPFLKLEEAHELAKLECSVLHARTLQPILKNNITLQLRSSYTPNEGSTCIKRLKSNFSIGFGECIVTNHENIVLVECKFTINNNFLILEEKIFHIFSEKKIHPLAIHKNIKNNTLIFCYTEEMYIKISKILQCIDIFNIINVHKNFSFIALVGSNISHNSIHMSCFWKIIKKYPYEFTYIAKNTMSVMVVISLNYNKKLYKDIFKSIFCINKKIGLLIFGIGNVGKCWLKLFAREYIHILSRTKTELVLAGMVNSKKIVLNYKGINPNTALSIFKKTSVKKNEEYLKNWMQNHPFDNLIILDITASILISEKYCDFSNHNFHIISANKFSIGEVTTKKYNSIINTFIKNKTHFLNNATVGAGLPIQNIIQDLRESGDTILSISGIFSGTLSWLFKKFDNTIPFSILVQEAWEKGLTEPDPRVDLSGKDVMRKLIILARTAGYQIEPNNITVESLISSSNIQKTYSLKNFFNNYSSQLNKNMSEKFKNAKDLGLYLRYVAIFNQNDNPFVGIKYVSSEDPLYSISPCDNIFIIKSTWYKENPLIIRGPGAGKQVTAGAIQSDINNLIKKL